MNFVYQISQNEARETEMKKTERKLRADLNEAERERERAERIGDLTYRSHRWPDMRVEKFIPSREQH